MFWPFALSCGDSYMPNPQRFCIFCGGGNLSKEHVFWPEWVSPLMGKKPDDRRQETFSDNLNPRTLEPVSTSKQLVRPGHNSTKKLRVVCKTCNETWMSRLEDQAKTVLLPLIAGANVVTLDRERQTIIATWIALKVLVAEHAQPDTTVHSPEARKKFMDSPTVPPGMSVWIARCASESWEAGYKRYAASIKRSPVPMIKGELKNVQALTFGVGYFFAHVLSTTLPGKSFSFESVDKGAIIPLWPISADSISWPPPRTITAGEANNISRTLSEFFSSPGIVSGY